MVVCGFFGFGGEGFGIGNVVGDGYDVFRVGVLGYCGDDVFFVDMNINVVFGIWVGL